MARYEDLITRELKEEVGERVQWTLDNHPLALDWYLGIRPENRYVLILFRAAFHGGEIQVSDEHTGWKWIPLDAQVLPAYFTSGHLQLLRKFLEL